MPPCCHKCRLWRGLHPRRYCHPQKQRKPQIGAVLLLLWGLCRCGVPTAAVVPLVGLCGCCRSLCRVFPLAWSWFTTYTTFSKAVAVLYIIPLVATPHPRPVSLISRLSIRLCACPQSLHSPPVAWVQCTASAVQEWQGVLWVQWLSNPVPSAHGCFLLQQ